MREEIRAEEMLRYLQSMMDIFMEKRERYGDEDRETLRLLDSMLACKGMVEALIGAPVNLGLNGKVTVGF